MNELLCNFRFTLNFKNLQYEIITFQILTITPFNYNFPLRSIIEYLEPTYRITNTIVDNKKEKKKRKSS
jgi:hypothetical protein